MIPLFFIYRYDYCEIGGFHLRLWLRICSIFTQFSWNFFVLPHTPKLRNLAHGPSKIRKIFVSKSDIEELKGITIIQLK